MEIYTFSSGSRSPVSAPTPMAMTSVWLSCLVWGLPDMHVHSFLILLSGTFCCLWGLALPPLPQGDRGHLCLVHTKSQSLAHRACSRNVYWKNQSITYWNVLFISFHLVGVMNTFENLTKAMDLLLGKLSHVQHIILECSLALEAPGVCEPRIMSPCSRMFSLQYTCKGGIQ